METSELQKIFSSPFALEHWQKVLNQVFGVTTLWENPINRGTQLSNTAQKIAESAWELGKWETKDGWQMGFYYIKILSTPPPI